MNPFDNQPIDPKSFAYRDLLGIDRWESFSVSTTAVFTSTATNTGRYRVAGRVCEFQASFAPTSTFATTSGTHYMNLPIPAKGIGGMAALTNTSTNVVAGGCAINVSESRVYFPSVTPSAATHALAGWYEIA